MPCAGGTKAANSAYNRNRAGPSSARRKETPPQCVISLRFHTYLIENRNLPRLENEVKRRADCECSYNRTDLALDNVQCCESLISKLCVPSFGLGPIILYYPTAQSTWRQLFEAPEPGVRGKVQMSAALPMIAGETGLARYLNQIRRFPMLEPQEEYMLAKRWREHQDPEAAHKLVTSHLRLVAKIAMGYRGYGLPISEVVSEGNVGLMQAVKRFEPDKGFRLATYAMWWIRAAIQEYILRSWSLVKMGTTANQKKLFFNLRRAKSQISALDEGDLRPDQVKTIARKLGVTEQDVVEMNRRMGGDASLNSPLRDQNEGEWQDWLVDGAASQESTLVESEEAGNRLDALRAALVVLNPRERRIFEARRLADDPVTLEALSDEFGISRERVRQIEVRAFEKVQSAVKARLARSESLPPPRIEAPAPV